MTYPKWPVRYHDHGHRSVHSVARIQPDAADQELDIAAVDHPGRVPAHDGVLPPGTEFAELGCPDAVRCEQAAGYDDVVAGTECGESALNGFGSGDFGLGPGLGLRLCICPLSTSTRTNANANTRT